MIHLCNNAISTLLTLAYEAPHGSESATRATNAIEATVVQPFLFTIIEFGIFAVIVAICLCLYRIVRGPHLADRVLAGDTIAFQVVGLVILLTIRLGSTTYLDAALAVAIIGFASTLAFAQYIGNLPRPVDKTP
jgi:multicomponent K+:H+ antiporter subunit F